MGVNQINKPLAGQTLFLVEHVGQLSQALLCFSLADSQHKLAGKRNHTKYEPCHLLGRDTFTLICSYITRSSSFILLFALFLKVPFSVHPSSFGSLILLSFPFNVLSFLNRKSLVLYGNIMCACLLSLLNSLTFLTKPCHFRASQNRILLISYKES